MTRSADPTATLEFRPADFSTFRFLHRSIEEDGEVRLGYALDGGPTFEERLRLPPPTSWTFVDRRLVDDLVALLHWVAGVSYYKTAAPPLIAGDVPPPPPAVARLLQALYSEGLGEFAVQTGLDRLPRPVFPSNGCEAPSLPPRDSQRVLVPVGGGKDSVVAIEAVRRSGLEFGLFAIGGARAISRTMAVAGAPRLTAIREIDPLVRDKRMAGALNGHVPVTAIVSCVALVVAALHGYDSVALANERSASAGNRVFDGVEINHQFSKGFRAERLLQEALAAISTELQIFSVLRPASELTIARAFARMPSYHDAFTSCNRIFKLEEALRTESWCCQCDKCRFVFLVLAPFLPPDALTAIFGRDLLLDTEQYEGFALLTGTGGHKPFECVGEVEESAAALRLLARAPEWRDHPVVSRLAADILPRFEDDADPQAILTLADEHAMPANVLAGVRALLGA